MEVVEQKTIVKPRRGCWIPKQATTVSIIAMEGFAVPCIEKKK